MPATFLMSFEPSTFVTFGWNHLISQLGRVVQYETDLQMSQAKELNQVMAKTTTCCKLFKIHAGYLAVSPNLRN